MRGVCARDAARQDESRRRSKPDTTRHIRHVGVSQGNQRSCETGETASWLITQRSRVQISPRYQGQRPVLEQGTGLLLASC